MAESISYLVKAGLRESNKLLLYQIAKRNDSFINNLPYRPVTLAFNITDNCNSRCITCTQWKNRSQNELTTEEVNVVLTQAKRLGTYSVGFAGGEPLLRTDLTELVKKARDLRYRNIHITTNGLMLTKERALSLLENGLRGITISIDGIGDTHDMVRGVKGGYERSIRTLRSLVELRDASYPYLSISIGTTLMRPTMSELCAVVELAKSVGVSIEFNLIDRSTYFFKEANLTNLWIEERDWDQLNDLITKLHAVKKSNSGLISTSHSSLDYMRSYFRDPKREDIPCYLGYSKIYIGPHGEVFSGCWSLPPVGNIRNKTLEEIVYSAEFRNRLKNMFLKKCPGCSCNFPTNLWYHIPSLISEGEWKMRK